MKKSRFNILVDKTPDYALIFNSFSRGFVELEKDVYQKFDALKLDSNDQIAKELKKGFFLLDDDVDEDKVLQARNRVSRYKGYRLGLLILPTLNCNFSCEYCFEDKQRGFMSPDVEQSIVGFIKSRVGEIRELKMSWFGGEPLLATKIIDRLAREIIDLCEANNVAYHSDLTTNGYLLNQKNIDWLKEIRVEQIQVTLDGDRETHDQRRKLKNGKPTFDTIISNLKLAAGHFGISIRVNIDRKNKGKVNNLLPVLVENNLQDKVYVYYGIVVGITNACRDYEPVCLDVDQLSDVMFDLHKDAIDNKYDFVLFPYPLSSVGGCGAMRPDFFVIDPKGFVHKCLNSAGNEKEAVGHISRPIGFTPELVTWLTWDPLEDEVCSQCKLLPLCSGGCLWNKLHGLHSCGYHRDPKFMNKLLKLYHEYTREKEIQPVL